MSISLSVLDTYAGYCQMCRESKLVSRVAAAEWSFNTVLCGNCLSRLAEHIEQCAKSLHAGAAAPASGRPSSAEGASTRYGPGKVLEQAERKVLPPVGQPPRLPSRRARFIGAGCLLATLAAAAILYSWPWLSRPSLTERIAQPPAEATSKHTQPARVSRPHVAGTPRREGAGPRTQVQPSAGTRPGQAVAAKDQLGPTQGPGATEKPPEEPSSAGAQKFWQSVRTAATQRSPESGVNWPQPGL